LPSSSSSSLADDATLLALRTSTATYLPMSDHATIASTLVSLAMMTRTARSRLPSLAGASSTRSL
jgi:hypothetical protein